MGTYVTIKEYPDGHRLYRLLQAPPRELEHVRLARTEAVVFSVHHT